MSDVTKRDKNNKTRGFYICSTHFVGGKGPTEEFPDPIVNPKSVIKIKGKRSCRSGNQVECNTSPLEREVASSLVALSETLNITSEDDSSPSVFYIEKLSYSSEDTELVLLNDISNEPLVHKDPIIVEPSDKIVINESLIHEEPLNMGETSQDSQLYPLISIINETLVHTEPSTTTEPSDDTQLHPMVTISNVPLANKESSEDTVMDVNSEEIVHEESLTSLIELGNRLNCPPGWFMKNTEAKLELFTINETASCITLKLIIDQTFHPKLNVLNSTLQEGHKIYEMLSKTIRNENALLQALLNISKWVICCGNGDEHLKTSFLSRERRSGYICPISQVVRSQNCLWLFEPKSKSKRCAMCMAHRAHLRSIICQQKKQNNNSQSKLKYKSLKKDELIEKLKKSKVTENGLKVKRTTLQDKFKRCMEIEGARLDKSSSKAFEGILKEHVNDETHSFTKQFLYEQIKMLNTNPKARKWHPSVIKWCIYIKTKSPATYKALQETSALTLPTERTLYNYTARMIEKPGFQTSAFIALKENFLTVAKEDHQKYVCISIDEVKIRQDVVYHKASGEMIGFVELDDALTKIRDLEQRTDNNAQGLDLATHVLQMMIRGITTGLKFPLAFFPTSTLTSDSLNHLLWSAIERLEGIGCRVLAIVGDGASVNRRCFKMNGGEEHFCRNKFARDEDRKLYFIFDAPHLMKTTRNCFSKSGKPKFVKKSKKSKKPVIPPRRLFKNGKEILWSHLEELYDLDSKNITRKLPKLKYEHIHLDSYSRMRVKLATQVLSESVALGMEMMIGTKASETVEFIRHMNKFFDIMNISNITGGIRRNNENLHPIKSVDDCRLKWLESDFLSYFADWENDVNSRDGNFSKSARSSMMLSHETLEGIHKTSRSVIEICRFIINKGASYVLTTHLNQDYLEQHFGKIRSLSGACDNPNIKQYGESNIKTQILRDFVRAPCNGNSSVIVE